MDNLNHALNLYRDDNRIRTLRIDYILSDDESEKRALRMAILKLKDTNNN